MGNRRFLYCLLIVAGLTTGLGVAFAQNEDTADDESGEAEGEGEGIEATATTQANLSPQEQLAETNAAVELADRLANRLQAMLDEARRESDVMRINCLNDKLTQTNATARVLAQRREDLEGAIESGNDALGDHTYTVVTVLQQRLQTLEGEGNACIGQDIYETGATRVIADISDDTPTGEQPQVVNPPPEGYVPPYIPPPMSADR